MRNIAVCSLEKLIVLMVAAQPGHDSRLTRVAAAFINSKQSAKIVRDRTAKFELKSNLQPMHYNVLLCALWLKFKLVFQDNV